jgi:hypothetical protein
MRKDDIDIHNQYHYIPGSSMNALRALCCALLGGSLLVAAEARANPRPLPFTYPYATMPEGGAELEQYLDLTPVKKYNDDRTKRVFDGNYKLQTEFEYGITDHLELGLYLVFVQDAPVQGDPTMKFDGTKQRLRYRIAEEGVLPVDIALYFEVAELHDEFELEQKVIVAKRFGLLKLITNFWVEQEWERDKSAQLFLNPTVGATYQLDPRFSAGLEYWGRGQLANEAAKNGADPSSVEYFNASFHHYLGPAVLFSFGKLWWSTAAYLRLDEMKRTGQVGDAYGKVWIRSVVGVDL